MKTFKEFITESGTRGVPVISIEKTHIDLTLPETLMELNRNLAQVSSIGFINPYIALDKISKALSTYGLTVPSVNILNEPGGQVVFEMQQWGNHTGYDYKFNQTVNGIQSNSGPTPPQDSSHPKVFLHFIYEANCDGVYKCHAALMNSEGASHVVTNNEEALANIGTNKSYNI